MPLLVVIVRLGVHLPTLLRGFIFYAQISPIAVEYLHLSFRLRIDIVSGSKVFQTITCSLDVVFTIDVLHCKHLGSLRALRLQLPRGNDITGVVWTEIHHSPGCTHCGTNSSKSEVRMGTLRYELPCYLKHTSLCSTGVLILNTCLVFGQSFSCCTL